jgi:hypothetical protein
VARVGGAVVLDARFESGCYPASAADRTILGREMGGQAEGAHLPEQDEIAGGSAAVHHFAPVD